MNANTTRQHDKLGIRIWQHYLQSIWKEFPTGGMNEKGLVIELMQLDETRYPSTDERPAIGVLQWI